MVHPCIFPIVQGDEDEELTDEEFEEVSEEDGEELVSMGGLW